MDYILIKHKFRTTAMSEKGILAFMDIVLKKTRTNLMHYFTLIEQFLRTSVNFSLYGRLAIDFFYFRIIFNIINQSSN